MNTCLLTADMTTLDRDRLIEDIAAGLADVDASHEVFHQRPYMEWARVALEIIERATKA